MAVGHCLAAGRWIQHCPRSAGPFSALFAPGRRTPARAARSKGGHCFAAGRLDPALLSVGEYFLLSSGGYFLLALLTTHPIALWPITTVTATVYLMISQYLAHKHVFWSDYCPPVCVSTRSKRPVPCKPKCTGRLPSVPNVCPKAFWMAGPGCYPLPANQAFSGGSGGFPPGAIGRYKGVTHSRG